MIYYLPNKCNGVRGVEEHTRQRGKEDRGLSPPFYWREKAQDCQSGDPHRVTIQLRTNRSASQQPISNSVGRYLFFESDHSGSLPDWLANCHSVRHDRGRYPAVDWQRPRLPTGYDSGGARWAEQPRLFATLTRSGDIRCSGALEPRWPAAGRMRAFLVLPCRLGPAIGGDDVSDEKDPPWMPDPDAWARGYIEEDGCFKCEEGILHDPYLSS